MILRRLGLSGPRGARRAVHLLPLGATEPARAARAARNRTRSSPSASAGARPERLRGEVDVLVLPAVLLRRHPVRRGLPRRRFDRRGDACARWSRRSPRIFERIVVVNSHLEPEQVWTLRATGLPLLDITRRANAGAPDRRVPGRRRPRGPLRDLARVLAERPELRRPGRDAHAGGEHGQHADGDPVRAERASSPWEWTRLTRAAPAEATAEEGERTFEALADMLVELIREVAA